MIIVLLIGAGAGLVSALLFAVVVTGSPLALFLSFVAPLPVFIATLGWQHRAGLVAGAVGAVVIAFAFRWPAGVAFALGWALPAWWLAYLALLGRPAANGVVEWYPIGRLLLWLAGTAAVVAMVGVVALGNGDYETFRTTMQRVFQGFWRAHPGAAVEVGASDAFVDGIVAALPFIVAASFTTILAANLWLSAKAVAISQRLARPWPFLPLTSMPRSALALFAGAAVLVFLPGFVGASGLAVLGALTVAFALHGLALMHDVSRGRPARATLLTATYFVAFFLSQIGLPALALTGMADAAFGLRRRFGGGAGPSPSPRQDIQRREPWK
jgi:Predicted membrane protein (DUF2232)